MKLYTPTPAEVIRLQIKRATDKGEDIKYIAVCDTTMAEVVTMVQQVIDDQKISVWAKGLRTAINIRQYIGAEAGKSISVSFKGLTSAQTEEIILNHIKVLNAGSNPNN